MHPVCNFYYSNSLFTCCAYTGDCLAYFCISDRCCFSTADLLRVGAEAGKREEGDSEQRIQLLEKKKGKKKERDLQRVRQGASLNVRALVVANPSLLLSQINQSIVNAAV